MPPAVSPRSEVLPAEKWAPCKATQTTKRCGWSQLDASSHCGYACTRDADCRNGRKCHPVSWDDETSGTSTTTNPPFTLAGPVCPKADRTQSAPTTSRCGHSKADANDKCGCRCVSDDHCPSGQKCFTGLALATCEQVRNARIRQVRTGCPARGPGYVSATAFLAGSRKTPADFGWADGDCVRCPVPGTSPVDGQCVQCEAGYLGSGAYLAQWKKDNAGREAKWPEWVKTPPANPQCWKKREAWFNEGGPS